MSKADSLPDARGLSALPDDELLEAVQRQTFRFFWEGAHPDCGLARDRIPVGPADREDLVVTGGSGFGVMALLAEYRVELDGARAVVVGRSDIVGKPVAHLLLQANATVTICHSHTEDLSRHTLDADVLVVAAGRAGIVTADMVKTGSAVVDVGINRTEAGVVGDVDPGVADVAAYLTPVPGGVGPMTIACLLQNAVRCARERRGI